MAKPDNFGAVNDAAADTFFDLLANPESISAKAAEIEAREASPASSDDGTTPSNDDGETPATHDDDESGNEVVEGKPSTSTEQSAEFDPEKTLAKYKTPEDKEKALVESQRTLLQRGEENKRLKAELDALKAAKTTPAAEKPTEPAKETQKAHELGYDEWLGQVHQAKPEELSSQEVQVKRAIASLGEEKKSLATLEEKTKELETKVSSTRSTMEKDKALLDAMIEDFKDEPDDFALENRIAVKRSRIEKAQQDLTALRLDWREQSDLYDRAARTHEARIVELDRGAQRLHSGIARKATETVTRQDAETRATEDWNTGQEKFFGSDLSGLDLTAGERKSIALSLSNDINEYATKNNSLPGDFYQWMKTKVPDIAKTIREERLAIQRRIVSGKMSLQPSKPQDNVVKARSQGGKPSSFKSSLKEAESALDRAWPA